MIESYKTPLKIKCGTCQGSGKTKPISAFEQYRNLFEQNCVSCSGKGYLHHINVERLPQGTVAVHDDCRPLSQHEQQVYAENNIVLEEELVYKQEAAPDIENTVTPGLTVPFEETPVETKTSEKKKSNGSKK